MGIFLTNLGLLLDNFWPICHDCIYPVEQLLKEIIIPEYNFDWWLFWTLKSSCHGFGETFSASFYKLLSTCPKEERLCCPTFEEKILFQKVLVIFKELTDSKQKPIRFFPPNNWQGSQSCILGVQKHISRRKTYLKEVVFKFFLSGFEKIVLGLFPKISWQISRKAFYVCRGTVCGKLWVRKSYETKNFHGIFWQISDFWWKISGRFVKTAFYLSSNFLMESSICEWNIDW